MTLDLFPLLVKYHVQTLDDLVRKDGLLPADKYDLAEGSDKNVPYHGFLILADGPEIFDRLQREGLISDMSDEILREYDSSILLTKPDFFDYLKHQDGEDGAYVFNSRTGHIVSCQFNNNPGQLPDSFNILDAIPIDFVRHKGQKVLLRELGTKTRIAIKIPASMDSVHAYQIKRSPYGNKSTGIGMGKVTHFDRYGLLEEFFFMRNEGVVVGVYRDHSPRRYNEQSKDLIMSDLSEFDGIRIRTREQYEKAV